MAAALIVAGVCVLLGLTVRAIQHRTRHTHMRDTSRFADPLYARFDAAMDKATKERRP